MKTRGFPPNGPLAIAAGKALSALQELYMAAHYALVRMGLCDKGG